MNKKNKYGLFGFSGRLGSEVISVLNEKGYELTFKYNSAGENNSNSPDILIDCSLPEVLEKSIKYSEQFTSPLIVATTGLSDSQINSLKKLSEKIPVVQSYNFSIGIQVMLKLVESANEKLSEWDVEIIESHHRFKKDKPSGTAKMIKNIFPKDVNVSSLRVGNVPGDHTVEFGGLGEVLSISHRALSRRTFAEGILKSVEFLLKKEKGFYTFTDVLFK